MYVFLTADVASSRKVPNRDALQSKIAQLLKRLGKRYSQDIVVRFAISGGDEFQGLLKREARILPIISELQRALYPVRARVGIGFGGISTGFRQRPQEMDGEAFAFSREALEQARKNGSWLWFRTPNVSFDLSANTISLLLTAVKGRWKQIHWRRAELKGKGWTEGKIAKKEGVTQVAVHSSLRTAQYRAVGKAEENLANLIGQSWTDKPTGL